MSQALEKAIKRGGEDSEKVINLADEDGVIQGSDEPINEDMVPNQGAQQLDPPQVQPPPSPPPAATNHPMIDDTEHIHLADTTMGGTKLTLGDDDPFKRYDLMLDVRDMYFNDQEGDHREIQARNVEEGVQPMMLLDKTRPRHLVPWR